MSGALESLSDPLVTPVLALLKDAINADLADAMTAAGLDVVEAVKSTSPIPFELRIEGADTLPALNCYRVRSRSRQFSAVFVDHVNTLQFVYCSPSAARELLDDRWPLLDRVWRSLLTTLKRGTHEAHQDGADVMCTAGLVKVELSTALKREAFIEHGGHSFPGFVAEVDVIWRDGTELDTSALYPALSFETRFFVNGTSETGAADVTARALTPTGEQAEDETPFEEEGDL